MLRSRSPCLRMRNHQVAKAMDTNDANTPTATPTTSRAVRGTLTCRSSKRCTSATATAARRGRLSTSPTTLSPTTSARLRTILLPPACVRRTGCEPEMVGVKAGRSCATSRRCHVWQPGRQSSRRSGGTWGIRGVVILLSVCGRARSCRPRSMGRTSAFVLRGFEQSPLSSSAAMGRPTTAASRSARCAGQHGTSRRRVGRPCLPQFCGGAAKAGGQRESRRIRRPCTRRARLAGKPPNIPAFCLSTPYLMGVLAMP